MTPPLGIYLHVPYCAAICDYCDFTKYVAGDRSGWASSAVAELAIARRVLGAAARPVDTVFFGGGTPTLLPPRDLGMVLRAIRDELGLRAGAEVTVEANPEDLSEATLDGLLEAGVTRLSIGMQSAVPHVLRALGRTHAPSRPVEAARAARAAGFAHVSLDLIYGAPEESADDWRASLEAALSAEPDHVSAYGLTVAPGTRLHARIRHGASPAPAEDALADRYLLAEELLGAAGLAWYEVSNWARTPADRCVHNVHYWRGGDWWGIGPGAHSAVGGRRWWNVKHPARWARMVASGAVPEDGGEELDAPQRALERLMLEVRTREGVPVGAGPREAGADGAAARELAHDGRLDLDGAAGRAVLTLRGRLLADLVTRRLAA